jgi:SPP1 gp7 family putative phage head morphogenesis protein
MFQAKVRIPTAHWTDVWEGEHARGFMVAGAMQDDLLTDFQTAIQRAISDGTTLEQFRTDFDDIVKRHGWTYNGERGWRTRVIYNTNLRQAHMAGRWGQAKRLAKSQPVYLRYVAVMDARTRDQHRQWHGLILPIDHPFWQTHYPMNGWGCRCTVEVLTERDLKRRGLTVSDDPVIEYEDHVINTPSGHRTVTTPQGIHPGFASNQGEAAWGRALSDQTVGEMRADGTWRKWTRLTKGDWESAGRPQLVPSDAAKASVGPKLDRAGARQALHDIMGGEQKVYTMPDGAPLLMNAESLAEHIGLERTPYLPLLPELIESPFEIWQAFDLHEPTGRIALRRRLIKLVQLRKNKLLLLVATSHGGVFEGWTFIPISHMREANKLRTGKMIFGRE